MFKILNEASEEEVAIISTVVEKLKAKKTYKATLSNWKLADLRNKKTVDTWEDKFSSIWKQEGNGVI